MDETARLFDAVKRTWPGMPDGPVHVMDGGQHHALFVLGEEHPLVVRVARYPSATSKARLRREHDLLLRLEGRLPLPIPTPVHGVFADGVPAYFVYPRLLGDPLGGDVWAGLGQAVRTALARGFGEFLVALHASADAAGGGLSGEDPWASLYQDVRATVFAHLPRAVRDRVTRHFEEFLAGHREVIAALVHGDFGTTNLLWDPREGRAGGVLDFSEAALGDPAVDLAAFRTGFGEAALSESGYPVDPGTRRRMDFYEGTFALQEAVFGARHGDREAFSAGVAGTIARFSCPEKRD